MIITSLIFGVIQGYSQEKATYNKIVDNIFVFNHNGTNYTIVTSDEGLLIIDTGYPGAATFADSTIRADFKLPVKYVVNTHYHYDHVGGNHLFAKNGAPIIAHKNTRKRMLIEWNMPEFQGLKYPVFPPYADEYLPDICFSDSLKIYFGNETIDLIHLPPGHSDCDVIVCFKIENIVVTGDVYLGIGFPPIDFTFDGYLASLSLLISMCDKNTVVISGHGPVTNLDELILFRETLTEGASRIKKLKSEGKTIDEIVAAEPLKGLMERSYVPEVVFIYCILNGPINE